MSRHSYEPLRGHTALITGGARRLGAAITRLLHGSGANVLVHYHRSSVAAATLIDELNSIRPGSAAGHCANLLEVATLPRIVSAAIDAFGRLDVLVNNASTFYPTRLGEITLEAWDDLMGSNLRAPLFLSQAAAPELSKRQGLILNIADIHGLKPLKAHVVYCAAKAGLVMLTYSLARELGPAVRVNAIAPGPVMWPEAPMSPEMQATIVGRTALKRVGTPQDVAKAALYFAAEAPFVTGQVLAIDGGRSTNGF